MSKIGFLLAEDEAIKIRFSGITVSDDREPSRPVQVFFRYPDGETEKHYPFITIELIDIVHAKNRQHSDHELYAYVESGGENDWILDNPSRIDYWPSTTSNPSAGVTDPGVIYLQTNEFVPVDILYQVSTYTRSALHDRQLSSKILSKIAPFRFNSIYVEADNTSRRFELLDWTTADLLDSEAGYRKRIFRKIYTLQMSAELPSSDLLGIKQVQSVQTTIDYNL